MLAFDPPSGATVEPGDVVAAIAPPDRRVEGFVDGSAARPASTPSGPSADVARWPTARLARAPVAGSLPPHAGSGYARV